MSEIAPKIAQVVYTRRLHRPSKGPEVSSNARTHPSVNQILSLQGMLGNRAVQRLLQSGLVHGQLKIGQPNDAYEKEADSVADQVMRMPESEIRMKPT